MPGPIGYGTPLASLAALSRASQAQQVTLAQISAGQRITSAAIDPAGLAVFAELDASSASTRVAMRNSNDGISLLQTAEGATSSVTDNLKRMRELAVQASSGTLNADQRASIDAEFQQLQEEIDRTSGSAEFNGLALADGSTPSIDVQVGTDSAASSRVSIGLADLSTTALGVDTASLANLTFDYWDLDNDGIYAEALPVDLDGTARLQGLGLDMGAYER